jgi:GntR family carbon starvation induced transcriptional regulator
MNRTAFLGDAGPVWAPDGDTPPRTLAERAMHLIYDDIVGGRLEPGCKLKPDELARAYALGTSPIREGLLRLSAEGLVRLEGQRGFSVPETTEAELVDIAHMRSLLSCRAITLAIERGDDHWEARIVAAYHRLEKVAAPMKREPLRYRDEWDRRNRDFHMALESACGSPWLLKLSGLAVSQSERYRRHTIGYDRLLPAVQHDHAAIMKAAIGRDAEAACRLLAEHIDTGAQRVLKAMRQAKTGRREPKKATPKHARTAKR